MLSTKKLLPISELQIGMISASTIYYENKLLLADGFAITESILDKLKHIYIIDKVDIYLEDNSADTLSLKMKTVKEIEATFNEFSNTLASIFNIIATSRNPRIEEVRIFSKRIQEEFHSIGSVIRNVIFYGSKNDIIYRHSINVTAISFILGKWLNLDERELNLLTYAALLHDFGKIKLGTSILYKKTNLTNAEKEFYKTHSIIGYNFIKQIPYLDTAVSNAVLMHHERMDGSGYPLHIKGDKIPKFAKIIAIADLFDEVSSNRYSEKIRGPFEALKVIQEEGFSKLDNTFCSTFLNHILNYYMGEDVLLSNDRSCKVIQVQINNLTNPLLLDDSGFIDLGKEENLYVENFVI